MTKGDRQYWLGLSACWFLALVSLGCGVFSTNQLLHLIAEGEKTSAVVADIYVGAKGTKRAVLEFKDRNGGLVKARDIFQLFIIRPEAGDHVEVMYDPHEPEMVTMDLGPWTWQQPVIFYAGFLFLAGLGLLLGATAPRL